MADTYVSSGTVTGQTVSSGNVMYVVSSGIADFTSVLSGGEQFVYSGGAASYTGVEQGGFLVVAAGGTETGALVYSGGDELVVSGGKAFAGFLDNGGEIDVISATASGIVIDGGGKMFALSGGQVFGTQIGSGGALYVSSGGQVSGTNLTGSGSLLYVASSGAVTSTFVGSGGENYVAAFGASYNPTVANGGVLDLAAGGVAIGSVISSGGTGYVDLNAIAQDVTVAGALYVSGSAGDVTVGAGGYESLSNGGMQSDATILSGGVVETDATAYGTTIANGGEIYIDISGYETDAVVERGGYADISGYFDATIQSGGIAVISSSAGDLSGTVESGAYLVLTSGTEDYSATIANGAHVISTGVAIVTRVQPGVTSFTSIDGSTLTTALETAYVLSGGSADDVTIGSLTSEYVYSGGTANNDTVQGEMVIVSGIASATTGIKVEGGDVVLQGGTMLGATISGDAGSTGFLQIDNYEAKSERTTVLSGGDETVLHGLASGSTIGSGGEQDVYGNGISENALVSSGGVMFVLSGGAVEYATIAGGTVNMASGGSLYGSLSFEGHGGTLQLSSLDLPHGTIAGFGAGDTIDFVDLHYGSTDSVSVGTAGTVTVSVAGTSYELNIEDATSKTPFYLAAGQYDGDVLLLDHANAPCFAAGTRILTPRGEVAVEELVVGDTAITNAGEDAPIVWIGHRRIDLARHPRPEQARPVRVGADAFGEGVPSRDLLLSPDHALFINDVLIPVKALINDRNIQQLARTAVTYFHIELAEHGVIFAENCAVETYLETGNRGAFANGGDAITLHPVFAQTLREQQGCAPFVEDGPVRDAVAAQVIQQYYATRAVRIAR